MQYTEVTLAKQFVELKQEFGNEVHTRSEWRDRLRNRGYAGLPVFERHGLFEVCGTEEYEYVSYMGLEATGTRELLKLADKLNVYENRVARVLAAKVGASESPRTCFEWRAEDSDAHRMFEAQMKSLERKFEEQRMGLLHDYMRESRYERELLALGEELSQYLDY